MVGRLIKNDNWKEKVNLTYEEYYKSPPHPGEAYITLVREMEKILGKVKAHEILMESRRKHVGASVRRRLGDKKIISLRDFINLPRPPIYQWALIREDVEASDERYVFKIHSCLWAKTWIELGAPDIGYLATCCSDHFAAKAMNPGLKLTRKGTIMQGAPCCDFCYTWSDE